MEDWVSIRNLKKRNPQLGTREIAKMMQISRNTVRAALRREEAPKYERRQKDNPDIKPFAAYILQGLTVRCLRKSRVLEDIKSKGYKGSKSAFYRYCEKIIQTETATYKPYETAPACQAQFDWSPYSIVVNGNLTKVIVFSYLHGFSRYRVYEASLSETMGSVFEALESSMIESGGVCERVQTDNATCFVTNPSKQNFQWNRRYLAFCGHYGFDPSRSLPSHPWSKGKVENPFDYLEDHFIKGNTFESFEDFHKRLKIFQDKVNNRMHSTTKAKPVELFKKEQPLLYNLPESRYVSIKEEVRKVSADCLISYSGSRYSVPYLFATRQVWVKVSKGCFINIYSQQNKLIACHRMSMVKGKVIIVDEHYKNHHIERGNWKRLSEDFCKVFPDYSWLPEKLKTQKKINPNYHLTRIMDMVKYYAKEDLQKAFNKCNEYNAFNANIILAFIEKDNTQLKIEPLKINKLTPGNIENIDIKRPLDYYKTDRFQDSNIFRLKNKGEY